MFKPLITIAVLLFLSTPLLAGWTEGVAAYKRGDFTLAALEFKEFVDQNPDNANGHFMLGLSLGELNRMEDSLHHLRKAHDLNSANLRVKIALSRAYARVGRYLEAAKVLDQVPGPDINALPLVERKSFYEWRSNVRHKSNNRSGAFEDYRTLAQLFSNDAQVLFRYGAIASNLGALQEAVAALDKATRLAPKDEEILRT